MKRLMLHIAFWLAYTLQDTVLMFVWVQPSLPASMSENTQMWKALLAVLSTLPSKMLLTYFVLYVSIKDLQTGRKNIWRISLELLFITILSIVLLRLNGGYIIDNIVYRGVWTTPFRFFTVRNVLTGLMENGFVAGIAAAIKFARMQFLGQEREKNLLKEKLETELKFLRNQTNPHFLMNTLNNIYALARKKSDDTAEVVMKLSELLRFMLYESGQNRIALNDEIKVLEDYLELERMRYNDRLEVSFTRHIDSNAYQITPLLLLPFVENAFKHGVSETRFESFVHINMHVEKSYLNFTVENSSEANPRYQQAKNIGLNNVRRQLELMYKDFNLDVQNGGNTFKVHLTLNLNDHVEI
jgi:two-component system, LytTR family, sensor kinase